MFRILCIFEIGIVGFGHPMIREYLIPPFPFYKDKVIKRISNMDKNSAKELFIRRAREIHGDKYDYSKVVYVNAHTKVCIICPIHGEFWQLPYAHLTGQCKQCGILQRSETRTNMTIAKKRLVYGVGINDSDKVICMENGNNIAYNMWHKVIERSFSVKLKEKHRTYKDCNVCEEWIYFSNFEKWFNEHKNEYHDGYHIDKDILVKGNKVYSPETCCFVPNRINTLFTKANSLRGDLPIGVEKHGDKYKVLFHKYDKSMYLGLYHNKIDAFNAYKKAKEDYIKEVANEYFSKGLIAEKVYNAMMNYEVEITD